jgi:hypothetical protein
VESGEKVKSWGGDGGKWGKDGGEERGERDGKRGFFGKVEVKRSISV